MAPQMPHATTIMSANSSGGRSTRADYNKEALRQIQASLLPYAAGQLPRERLSPNSPAFPGYFGLPILEEEPPHRGYNGYQPMDANRVVRKSSFDRELNNLHRGSPVFEGSNSSNRSDSPKNLVFANTNYRQYAEPPRLPSDERSFQMGGFPPADTPPPPPPRSQPHLPPPPTPPRSTSPPPLPPYHVSATTSMVSAMPALLSRLSPGPGKGKAPPANYVNIGNNVVGQQQSATPQRGTSPVSRQPVVVQNSAQVQQQLSQQMHALSLNGCANGQLERPPPYPLGVKSGTGVPKLTTPPPSYSLVMQHRQSPTQDLRRSPGCGNGGGGGILVTPHPVSPSLSPPPSSPVPLPRCGQTARQAKTPTPIIMQSVKSTQVQKPVLQTAIAPTPSIHGGTTPPPVPPPSYASSVQQKTSVVADFCEGVEIPTSDPPSYHSTIQAMAAARGGYSSGLAASTSGQPLFASIPVAEQPVRELDLSATPLAQIAIADEDNNHPVAMTTIGNRSSTASRSDSPVSSVSSQRGGDRLTQSPVSCVSNSSPSEITLESGYCSGQSSSRNMGPPPVPPHNKTTHHSSPIPERKHLNPELELQRYESKIQNLSPQAFKFYMEQHIENVVKSCEEREKRRAQLEKEMNKIGLTDKDQSQMRKVLLQKESNFIRLKRAKMDKHLFTKIKTIGVGAFGEVALVRKTDTSRLFAMKTLRKADVLKRNQVAHVKAERDILAEADNEWVVKLYYSFQDKDNLYFVMDYIPGGDLMSLLIKFGIFQEPLARFYIGELVCAIESVHKLGFIHRDIKPDNILIDRDGHIKLTDFGLCTGFRWTHNSKYYQRVGDHSRQDSMDPCGDNDVTCRCNDLKPLERRRRRQHLRCLAHSLVGTPNYIAPEVLARTGYTQLCDWWSVGVILYEMLVGQPPFLANTPAETQYKVINWEQFLTIPKLANLSYESKDLVLRLCTHANSRLGVNGPSEVKGHPFFNDLDFEGGLRKQPALYVPKIQHPTDTSNFDPIDPDKLRPSEPNESDLEYVNNGNQPLHAFFEFTFRRFFDSTPSGGEGGRGVSTDERDTQAVYV